MRCWSKSRGRLPWGLLNSIDTLSAFSVGMELFAALVAGLLLIACFLEAGHRHRATLLHGHPGASRRAVCLRRDAVGGKRNSRQRSAGGCLGVASGAQLLDVSAKHGWCGGLMRHRDATLMALPPMPFGLPGRFLRAPRPCASRLIPPSDGNVKMLASRCYYEGVRNPAPAGFVPKEDSQWMQRCMS